MRVKRVVVFLALASMILLQGCDIAYISKIRINEGSPDSVDPGATRNEEAVRKTFEGFCSKKGFSTPWGMNVLTDKDTLIVERCEMAWFYYLSLSKQQNAYEVELLLMQPGPIRTKTKFFCSTTAEMFDYFQTGLGQSSVFLDAYSGCR